jgi:hypothetical protein
MRRALIFAPFVVNLIACAAFLVARAPATALIEDRERTQQLGSLAVSSSDPYMLIAERPLRQWNAWHGDEVIWVKIVEVLDGPALIVTKKIGDRWAAIRAFSGTATYRRESWFRAYVFVIASSVQWLLLGLLIGQLMMRRTRSRLKTTVVPSSPP